MNRFCPACHQPLPDFDGLSANPDTHEVIFRGQRARLSGTEYRFFTILYERRGRIIDKGVLYDMIYAALPDCDQPDAKLVDIWVCKLRRKLRPIGVEIVTAWGRGYGLSRVSAPSTECAA
ncbi:MAG TPA: winged helix-turn-helix domain-containing protein [Rhizomicrobium sp.]|jgi:two-component system cell cycle response regulator CtrA|nr:winged helix-turn-helix domain-containing protein [Rhizomicrobium sp.]